ncbi:hypothetical protein MPLB_1870052 [Mesorhizobium sp. ORS 3324]|nr:hypothetical protein MPLB_1870052 [Mesorhizobium sp. ORS 3324]
MPRARRKAAQAFGELHASGLHRALELHGAVLGLPLPRLAVLARRSRLKRTSDPTLSLADLHINGATSEAGRF